LFGWGQAGTRDAAAAAPLAKGGAR
jgi:hypothetical protein